MLEVRMGIPRSVVENWLKGMDPAAAERVRRQLDVECGGLSVGRKSGRSTLHAPRSTSDGMNKTEAAFAEYLDFHQRPVGDVLHWGFERYKLRLAHKCFYTPDFDVTHAFTLKKLFYEVKGFMRDDAAVKLKVAAAMYPDHEFWVAYKRRTRDGGGWDIRQVEVR